MKVVLISCASKKANFRTKAQGLYNSTLFNLNLRYAKTLSPDKIFILSAKYGLLALDEEIDPYNQTLNNMSNREIEEWASNVIKRLKLLADLDNDEFIFLAGEKYRKYLLPYIKNFKIPLQGFGIGKQLQYLKNENERNL